MHGFFRHHGCARRAHGSHFGGFGAAFVHSGGLGGRGFFGGRKLGSGDLQLVIMALLEERPRHGYEIIKALEETSKGFCRAEPGMVYPALTYLEEVAYPPSKPTAPRSSIGSPTPAWRSSTKIVLG
jgi:hypothetical protein